MGLGLGLRIALSLSFALVLVAGSEINEGFRNSNKEKKHNCTYTVIIETTCTEGAGTDAHISLRFGDSTPTDILTRHLAKDRRKRPSANLTDIIDVPDRPFQECTTDVFKVTGTCVRSQVCYLYLKQRGEDNWRPGRAQVLVDESPEFSSKNFYFRRVLPRGVWHGHDMCTGKVTPFGVKQERKVFAPKHGLKYT
ncbi:uncharacterized protein A4U43_C07F3340 [Asparagus officinalis]|uniref:PLAT domain-containing protein n=2 Tax=Asparagus officinalis TaxID=4686 RepID=A0A5P1E900_ASPOF|nr:uncharacterized protein A4U43_C07F3340 [Asparagus officinalis]